MAVANPVYYTLGPGTQVALDAFGLAHVDAGTAPRKTYGSALVSGGWSGPVALVVVGVLLTLLVMKGRGL